jgi:hypothetical protein
MMKIIKRGLELFSVREDINSVSFDGGSLPPIYKSFVLNYEASRSKGVNPVLYLDDRYDEKMSLVRLRYIENPDYVSFGCFFSLEESIEIMSFAFNENKDLLKNYRLIGEDASGHYFLAVGLNKNNLDQIYIESSDLSFPGGERFTLIAQDIYQFINRLAFVEMEDGIGYGVEYSQLYKNWGEDFWRVRPSEGGLW